MKYENNNIIIILIIFNNIIYKITKLHFKIHKIKFFNINIFYSNIIITLLNIKKINFLFYDKIKIINFIEKNIFFIIFYNFIFYYNRFF